MQDRPTASELLETIAGVLEADILDQLDGGKQHPVRVAANLCKILKREWELGADLDRDERVRLAELLGGDPAASSAELNRALCERLEQGDDEGFEARALEVLLANVRGKLRVAKPGHDAYDFAPELRD